MSEANQEAMTEVQVQRREGVIGLGMGNTNV